MVSNAKVNLGGIQERSQFRSTDFVTIGEILRSSPWHRVVEGMYNTVFTEYLRLDFQSLLPTEDLFRSVVPDQGLR